MFSMNAKSLSKVITFCSVVGLLLSSVSVEAQGRRGTKDGGGGGAYVCRDKQGEVKKSFLVDLWEATYRPYQWANHKGTLMVERNNVSAEAQFENAMQRLALVNYGLAQAVIKEKKNILSKIYKLDSQVAIALPDDLKVANYPKGCPPEGMMYYDDVEDHLEVDSEIMDKLETQTDLAAAWAHEAIYKVFRDRKSGGMYDGSGSMTARRLVGCLFSGTVDQRGLRNIHDDNCLKAKPINLSNRVSLKCEDSQNSITLFTEDTNLKTMKDLEDKVDDAIVIAKAKSDSVQFPKLGIIFHKVHGEVAAMRTYGRIKFASEKQWKEIDKNLDKSYAGIMRGSSGSYSGSQGADLRPYDYYQFNENIQSILFTECSPNYCSHDQFTQLKYQDGRAFLQLHTYRTVGEHETRQEPGQSAIIACRIINAKQ